MGSRIFVNRLVLDAYTMPGGDVYRWTRGIAREVSVVAAAAAPRRTGNLSRSIRTNFTGSNKTGVNFRVEATAPYGKWVSEGTAGSNASSEDDPMVLYARAPHRATGTRWMPYARMKREDRERMHVGGQTGNPYLQDSLRAVLLEHRLI